MTRIRLLAPGLIDYRELLGASVQDVGRYDDFWAGVHDPVHAALSASAPDPADPPVLEVRRTDVRGRFNRYTQIDVDTLERPVEALVLRLGRGHVDLPLPPMLDQAGGVTIEARLYDNGIFTVEAEAEVALPGSLASDASLVDDVLDELRESMVAWGDVLAHEVHDRYLVPVVAALRDHDRHGQVVAARSAGDDVRDHGRVLWVTRSLLVDPGTTGWRELAAYWVKDSAGDADPQSVIPTDADPHGHLVRWLNYLFVYRSHASPYVTETYPDEWAALRLAQYFYAAMENIDAQLTQVLAQSLSPLPAVTLSELQAELEDCSRRAQFITMHLKDVTKYLTRAVRVELASILAYWEFDEVVVAPVELKVAACERRLGELADQRNARASVFTDTILLGIGITSILGTTVALTEFGRTMAVDPGMAGYDTSQSSITSWIAAQPADLLLIASVGISVLLAVVYAYFRRAHR